MQPDNEFGILVIRSDGSRAHLYRDIKQLLVCAGEDRGGVEFFSAAGHRLAPVFDPGWGLQDLIETSDTARPLLVLERLRTAVRNMRKYLQDHPEAAESAGLDIEEGLAALPEVHSATLEEALQTCSLLSHSVGTSTDRSPWHNFWVHGIF